jgi:hypothetical protein
VRSIGVLLRRRERMAVLERHLTKRFHVRHLKAADSTADWLRGWLDDYSSAITSEHHAHRLLEVAVRVAPRREDLADLQTRVGLDGSASATCGNPNAPWPRRSTGWSPVAARSPAPSPRPRRLRG